MTSKGWAMVDKKGEIYLRTVSNTKRAAKVNAIVIRSRGNMVPSSQSTTADIDWMWDQVKMFGDYLSKVKVETAPD